jgi:signal transduction histidine kinase
MMIYDDNPVWSSSIDFPDIKSIDFQLSNLNLAKIKADIEVGREASIEGLEFSRYKGRVYTKIPFDEFTIIMVNPKFSEPVVSIYILELVIAITLIILLVCFVSVSKIFKPIQIIQDGTNRIGSGELNHRIEVKQKDDLGRLAKQINLLADNIEEMLHAKQMLNLGVSHELRSPLTRARLQVEMIEDDINKEDLLAEITAMETIISNLLDSEAINYGHKKLNLETFSLKRSLEKVIENSAFLKVKKVIVNMDTDDVSLRADQVLIEVVLKNILENAARFSPEENSTIEVKIEHHNDEFINVSIRDFGPGFLEEDIEKVTEPFYRTSKSRSRESGGFGLGLYLCKQIVLAHQGLLSISNHEEKGAVIFIQIPMEQ